MKSDLICGLCGAGLGYDHNNRHPFTLLDHYRRCHPSELEHIRALGKDFLEWKDQYGLSRVPDLILMH